MALLKTKPLPCFALRFHFGCLINFYIFQRRWKTTSSLQPSIVIIGAGAAGLCAARHLMVNDLTNVTILEAGKRVGGRVFSSNFGDYQVALGAEWIHGGDITNPLYAAAKRQGFITHSRLRDFRKGHFLLSDGKIINQNLSIEALDLIWLLYQEAKCCNSSSATSVSLEKFLRRRFEEETKNVPVVHKEKMKCVFNSLLNYFAFHLGDSPKLVNINELGKYTDIAGGDISLSQGIQSVLFSIYEALPKDSVQLEMEITKINWESENQKINIECEKKQSFLADHVIITPSLGYLKRNQGSLFSPRLPETKQNALLSLGFGRVNKIFLGYEVPFWRQGLVDSIRLAWRDEELGFFSSADWVKSVFSFDEIVDDARMLVGYVAGPGAEMMENLSDKRLVTHCTKLLQQFTGRRYMPEPAFFLRTHWCRHPLFLGSYSYLPVECSSDKERERLADPLPSAEEPRLLFAGEATHEQFYGTVHGAMLSGEREANRLLRHYQRPTDKVPY